MPSQNNTGRQYDKRHATTVVAQVAIAPYRFVAYDGGYPSIAGGAKDAQGVSESAANAGDALSVVTHYSYLVEAEAAIAFGALVKVGTDGRATPGTLTDHCGRALGTATQAGQLVEVQIYKHLHA